MRRTLQALLVGSALSTLFATAAAAQDSPATPSVQDADLPSSEIVVTGARVGQIKAIGEKRDADNLVDALYANDVGKLPDQNVAEAVKRLPGISVANDQGEGRYVIIRGIDPNLINTTLNGQTLPAPEPAGRVVKLDDLPSAVINAVVVSKSLLPSQDANAIGGEVAIRTLLAFDRKREFFFDARGAVGYTKLNGKSPYEVDGQIGGRFGGEQQFGAMVSINYSRRPIESENYQGATDFATYSGVPATNGLRDYNLVRARLGVVGNFDWHLGDNVKLYIRSSYSKFTDHETRDQNRLAITALTSAMGTTGTAKATGTILVRRREENDNTKSLTGGGEIATASGGKFEFSGGWTKAVKVDPIRSEFTFTTAKGAFAVNYDLATDPYSEVPSGKGFTDPSVFTFSKYNLEHRYTFEELWQGRVDFTQPIDLGADSSIRIGAKYLDRHKNDDHDKSNYKTGSTPWLLSTIGAIGNTDFYKGMFSFGERIPYFTARDYIAANPGVVKIDTAGTIADSLSADFDVREQILAGYAMATLRFSGVTILPGVRVEHTEDKTKAKLVNAASTLGEGFNQFGDKSYTDFFPGLNVKFDLDHGLVLRGAVTTSIGRPNYADLAPYVIVTDDPVLPQLAIGNPNLKPYRAVNFDASIEYYPSKDSVVSLGAFYKSIDHPIYSAGGNMTNATFANVTYAKAFVTQPINFDSEVLGGVEINAQTQFTFLPGFLSGFGISANYTHVEGHASAPGYRSGKIPLGYQSHDLGNVQIFYEKYGFAARVAFNYRSAYLDTVATSAAADQYTDGNGQLDVHASYQVTKQLTVFADGSNLTDAPWRRYIGNKNQLVERERYDYALRGGIQLHF